MRLKSNGERNLFEKVGVEDELWRFKCRTHHPYCAAMKGHLRFASTTQHHAGKTPTRLTFEVLPSPALLSLQTLFKALAGGVDLEILLVGVYITFYTRIDGFAFLMCLPLIKSMSRNGVKSSWALTRFKQC